VLEGGSLLIDEQGRLVTTEQCLLAPNRNPELDRSAIENALRSYLGVTDVVWLGRGLAMTATPMATSTASPLHRRGPAALAVAACR